jgi:hypothetical protein
MGHSSRGSQSLPPADERSGDSRACDSRSMELRISYQGYATFGLTVLSRLAEGPSLFGQPKWRSAREVVVAHSNMMVNLALLEFA